MPRDHGHAVENALLLVLAIFLPPCAVACVTGCGINFVLNLVFTLFLSYLGGVVHAICIVVMYGFREEEMARIRRQNRLRAKREGTRGGAFVRGSVNTGRGDDCDVDVCPPGEAAPGDTPAAYAESPGVDARDFGEDRKFV